MNKPRVLICDDNCAVHETIGLYLNEMGMEYISACNGEDALKMLNENSQISLVILDVMMPKLFGTDVCREIRKKSNIPIIMLSAKSEELDRIIGLELGADDYVTKPFSPREVAIRAKAILRRSQPPQETPSPLVIGNTLIDTRAYQVYVDNEIIKMTPNELRLLSYLMKNSGTVVSRNQILDNVWGEDYYGDVRAVDTLIARIRSKLISSHSDICFHSVYGVGYMVTGKKEEQENEITR